MIDEPEVVDSAAVRAAVIRLTIPRTEIQQAMGAGVDYRIALPDAGGGSAQARHIGEVAPAPQGL